MPFDKERTAYGPEALSRFRHILDEVSEDLICDGVPAELVRSDEMRTKLAQRLLGFARFWRTDTQIKQLLLRKLRNEGSASRLCAYEASLEPTAEPYSDGWMALRSAYLGVDQSEPIWRKSVPAAKLDQD
jgi:hypothetical protein